MPKIKIVKRRIQHNVSLDIDTDGTLKRVYFKRSDDDYSKAFLVFARAHGMSYCFACDNIPYEDALRFAYTRRTDYRDADYDTCEARAGRRSGLY